MKNIAQLIADDLELNEMLMEAFKWRGRHQFFLDKTMCRLAKKIWEKYHIDIEIYT